MAILAALSSQASAIISQDNVLKKPWQCVADGQVWRCKETSTKRVDLFSKKISSSARTVALVRELGWVKEDSRIKGKPTSCAGYYYLPPLPQPATGPLIFKDSPITVYADSPSYQINKDVKLKGNVEIIQPGRVLYADQATISPDAENNTVRALSATGHIRVQQEKQLILLADRANANLLSHNAALDNVYYLLGVKQRWANPVVGAKDPNFTGYAFGQADSVKQLESGVFELNNATYSTCSPESASWTMQASNINLNKNTGRGKAYNTVFKVRGVPILYFPYFSFPLDQERQSGFLYGSFSQTSDSGFEFDIPYYLNLAPNYDATITPNFYTSRGILLENEFRYLAKNMSGDIHINFMPHDKKADKSRMQLKLAGSAVPKENWHASWDYQYVSDDDYVRNFSSDNSAVEANKELLDRRFELSYSGMNWQFGSKLQSYQITGDYSLINRPYDLLPELSAHGYYENFIPHLNLSIPAQFSNFDKSPLEGVFDTTGQRWFVSPTLTGVYSSPYGSLSPALSIHSVFYSLQNISGPNVVENFPNSTPSRVIPQFTIDGKLHLEKQIEYNNHQYTQLLTPRLFYVYVPKFSQADIPVFDTSIINTGYQSLFRKNRFVGIDRVGDENKLTYALETSIQNDSGREILNAGIAQAYRFQDESVSLCKNPDGRNDSCIKNENPQFDARFSDLAGFVHYKAFPNWNMNLGITYDIKNQRFTSQDYQFQYKPDPKHIFNIGYQDIREDNTLLSKEQLIAGQQAPNLSQFTTSLLWGLTPAWSVVGKWNYSFTSNRTVDAFGGLEYSSCCWAIRFVQRSFVNSDDPNNPASLSGTTDNAFVIQFELKGLGSTTGKKLQSILQQVPGYERQSGFY